MENEKDEKGRFKPGHSGGPGRGKKTDRYPWAGDPVAFKANMKPRVLRVIAGMVDSPDQKIQREGAKLYIQLFGMDTEARANLLDPKMLNGFQRWFLGEVSQDDGADMSDTDEAIEGECVTK